MTGVIEAAQTILTNYEKVFTHPSTDFKDKSNLGSAISDIMVSDFYEINRDITLYINDVKGELMEAYDTLDEFRLPVDARPPSDICFVYLNNSEAGYLINRFQPGEIDSIDETIKNPCVTIKRVSSEHLPVLFGGYIISDKEQDNKIFMGGESLRRGDDFQNYTANAVISIALAISLINEPRYVVRGKAGTRQVRKQMRKGHGISVDAWHKIEWDITKPVKAKDDSDNCGWHMPLHYTRGHWRRGQDHWDDVVIRKDGRPYKWISGFWSGHPAYGVKKSYHAPKLGNNYGNV